MEKIPITANEASSTFGIRINHEQMPNGELRFRLISSDGNDYIRTVAGPSGAWQKAHFHSSLRETYIVESGWMALAEEVNGNIEIRVFRPSEVVTTGPTVVHNVYLPANAVIHTVKHGANGQGDWQESHQFTQRTAILFEHDLLAKSSEDRRADRARAITTRKSLAISKFKQFTCLIRLTRDFLRDYFPGRKPRG